MCHKIQRRRGEEHDECGSPNRETELRTNPGAKSKSDGNCGDEDRALPESGKEHVRQRAKQVREEVH
jgi:hypothetical protein